MSDIVYKNFRFSTPFLSGYKKKEIPIICPNGEPAWPEFFPLSKVNEIRANVGERQFSSQMMLKFVALDKVRLDPGAIHMYSDDFDAHMCCIGEHNITSATPTCPSNRYTARKGKINYKKRQHKLAFFYSANVIPRGLPRGM